MTLTNLRFPYKEPPTETEWVAVADGIFWLRFPLPFALNHVHVWLLRDGPGWFVIDSGIGGTRMHALWDNIIATNLEDLPITRLLITHFHPDHMGSAGYLYNKFQPELLMTPIEHQQACRLAADTHGSNSPLLIKHYQLMGLPPELIERMTSGGNRYAKGVDQLPATFTPLAAGDQLTINRTVWQVLTGGGHSPDQVMLYAPARHIFIAADQVLPKISPNVSTWAANPTHDALREYLHSLQDLHIIKGDPLVLPSHNLPFYGLRPRLEQLTAHHAERLEEITDFCRAAPRTIYEITTAAFKRELDHTQMSFGIGEMLAHANYLLGQDALQKNMTPDGVWRFSS